MSQQPGTSADNERFAVEVVQQLRAAGFVAYFAGGCVRDSLLSRRPKDFDVATNALPEQVRRVFGRYRTLAIGESFGVITVLGRKDVNPIEVATFRSDGPYSDGRHPDHVAFSTPEQDAARRDFTINGMFYDPLSDEVIDFVGGEADLRRKQIRAIGNPLQRIAEDRLRMLRAVRFAATYCFEIEPTTFEAIRQQSAQITQVSQERITNELERMLCHAHRAHALDLLRRSGLLAHVLPHAAQRARDLDAWRIVVDMLDGLDTPSFALVLAVLLGTQPAPLDDVALSAECRRLKVSNEVRDGCRWLVASVEILAQAADLRFSQLQPVLMSDHIALGLAMLAAINRVTPEPSRTNSLQRCHELLKRSKNELNPAPLIGGHDLARLGIPAGPTYKRILQVVRDKQLDAEITTKQAALEEVRRLVSESG